MTSASPMLQNSPVGTVYLLKRAELATRGCVEAALADCDLTPTQFLTLLRLKLENGLSSAALARAVGVKPQSVTEIVKPLEDKGLIRRDSGTGHHRSLHIELTAKGAHALAKALRIAQRLEKELLADLSATELRALRNALDKLRARAEAHELHPSSRRTIARKVRVNKMGKR